MLKWEELAKKELKLEEKRLMLELMEIKLLKKLLRAVEAGDIDKIPLHLLKVNKIEAALEAIKKKEKLASKKGLEQLEEMELEAIRKLIEEGLKLEKKAEKQDTEKQD